jgi:uncharacterized protein DUF3467
MEDKNKAGVVSTEGYPSLYSNHASVSMSAIDIRIFLSEVAPKEMNLEPQDSMRSAEPLVQPRVCLVMSPEFARTIMDSLATLIPQYEARFGPLRPAVPAKK